MFAQVVLKLYCFLELEGGVKVVKIINEGAWGVPCDNVSELRSAAYITETRIITLKDHRDIAQIEL